MDLDTTYKDRFGDPLLRFTINWGENKRKMVEFVTPIQRSNLPAGWEQRRLAHSPA